MSLPLEIEGCSKTPPPEPRETSRVPGEDTPRDTGTRDTDPRDPLTRDSPQPAFSLSAQESPSKEPAMSVKELAAKFKPTQILKTDTQTKSVVLLGTIDNTEAICSLEKTAFAISEVAEAALSNVVDELQLINNNDVYFWALATLAQDLKASPGVKVNFIFPASETHIRKYKAQAHHMVAETPEIYRDIVRPFIDTQKGDRIQWVYNILYEGKEAESFIHHDKDPKSGFVLLPDMKWDGTTLASLYLITIVNRRDISSVRDIDGSHVEFLSELAKKIKRVVSDRYPVAADRLRLFVHYQPSYYHFHIHVVNIAHPGLGDGLNVGKAILLDHVVDNVKMVYDYYQRCTMHYQLGENHKLWAKLNAGGEENV